VQQDAVGVPSSLGRRVGCAQFSRDPRSKNNSPAFTDKAPEICQMLGTNRQFEALIDRIEIQIESLERSARDGPAERDGAMLDELCTRRQALRLLLLNRRVEAAKPVVDFEAWRDGNGAIYLGITPSGGTRKAAR
jgi:hypothetical protein